MFVRNSLEERPPRVCERLGAEDGRVGQVSAVVVRVDTESPLPPVSIFPHLVNTRKAENKLKVSDSAGFLFYLVRGWGGEDLFSPP